MPSIDWCCNWLINADLVEASGDVTTSTFTLRSLSTASCARISSASGRLSAVITRCFLEPSPRLATYTMPRIRANRAGRPIVDIRKALARICSRYSRLAISSMLRIGGASHGLDKDLFKRWFQQLKAIDRCHSCCFTQKLLRIAVGLESNLGVS